MSGPTVATGDNPPARDRRTVLRWGGAAAAMLSPGCLLEPSSGGPSYESREIDDGPVFGPGLQDELERDYFAALVVTAAQADEFRLDRLSDAATAFVTTTDFTTSYLGVIQVSAIDPSRRIDLVDLHESDVSLTVVGAVRGTAPGADDRVITTVLLRVDRARGSPPDTISVELDVGGDHETFSGARV